MTDDRRQLSAEQQHRSTRLNIHAPETGNDGDGAYYDGIGAELKAERLRWGLTLEEVSARLRIRKAHLDAIEAGRFGDLPGRIYAIGFLRSYAEFLGADGDVCISLFKAEAGPGGHSRKLVFPVPPSENRRPGFKTLAASILLAAAVYGGWYAWQNEETSIVELVPEVPQRIIDQAQQADERRTRSTSALSSANAAEAADPIPEVRATAEPSPEIQSIDLAVVGRDVTAANGDRGNSVASTDNGDELSPGRSTDQPAIAAAAETSEVADSAVTESPVIAEVQGPAPRPQTVETTVPQATSAAATSTAATSQAGADAPVAVSEPVQLAVAPPPVPEIEPQSGSEPRVFGVANRDARVLVRATGPVQIIVKRLDGTTVMPHRVMQNGDVYRAPNRNDVLLEADRMGNLQFIVDGRLIGRGDRMTEPGVGLALGADLLRAHTN